MATLRSYRSYQFVCHFGQGRNVTRICLQLSSRRCWASMYPTCLTCGVRQRHCLIAVLTEELLLQFREEFVDDCFTFCSATNKKPSNEYLSIYMCILISRDHVDVFECFPRFSRALPADGALLGAALVYVIQLGGLFQWTVRQAAEVPASCVHGVFACHHPPSFYLSQIDVHRLTTMKLVGPTDDVQRTSSRLQQPPRSGHAIGR